MTTAQQRSATTTDKCKTAKNYEQVKLDGFTCFPLYIYFFIVWGLVLCFNSFVPEQSAVSQTHAIALPSSASSPHQAMHAVDSEELKYFLATAPAYWARNQVIRRCALPDGEFVSCVCWRNLFHITGTDIMRCLVFRFAAFGRRIANSKKFEEGVFSDLRCLKIDKDAILEESKSDFLRLLWDNQCVRTQKKQKVFYWYAVPHDRLFLEALERDFKREYMGLESTSTPVAEPALSFHFDPTRTLYEQLDLVPGTEGLEGMVHRAMLPDTMQPPFLPDENVSLFTPLSRSFYHAGQETARAASRAMASLSPQPPSHTPPSGSSSPRDQKTIAWRSSPSPSGKEVVVWQHPTPSSPCHARCRSASGASIASGTCSST